MSRHNERPTQTITLVLQSFKGRGGFDVVNQILGYFASEIRSSGTSIDSAEHDKNSDQLLRFEVAVIGMKHVLSLYKDIVNGKQVMDALQTTSMSSRAERDRGRPNHFSPSQFLVELRMIVLPVVRQLWQSDLVEKAPSEISEKIIEVIRTIAAADNESGAAKRSDKATPPAKAPRKDFKPSREHRVLSPTKVMLEILQLKPSSVVTTTYPSRLNTAERQLKGRTDDTQFPKAKSLTILKSLPPGLPPTRLQPLQPQMSML